MKILTTNTKSIALIFCSFMFTACANNTAPENPNPTPVITNPTPVTNPICGESEVVFHCKTENKKEIKVCKKGSNFTYTFGTKEKLEKSVQSNDSNVIKQSPTGSSMKQSIGFKSGQYTYSVFSQGASTGGVSVLDKNRLVATVKCQPDTIVDNIKDVL